MGACILLQSAVRCDGTVSDYFPVSNGVRQGGVLAPTLFKSCVDHILGKMSENSGCGLSCGTVRITDLVSANITADDAVMFEVFAGALVSLSEGAEPLRLRVSWIKTKVQAFGDILDVTVESIPVYGKNVDVTQTFTYLGSVIYSSRSC